MTEILAIDVPFYLNLSYIPIKHLYRIERLPG